jgi:FkbM family methyltransferase
MLPSFLASIIHPSEPRFHASNIISSDKLVVSSPRQQQEQQAASLLRKDPSATRSIAIQRHTVDIDLTEVHAVDCSAVSFIFHQGMFVNTITSGPSFEMNIHSPKKDTFVSRALAEDGCFECDILEATMHALSSDASSSKAILLDIGSNIGFYSLNAASRGHDAIAFEPFRINWECICRSILQTNAAATGAFSEKVTLFSKAATNHSTLLQFDTNRARGNLGGIQVKAANSAAIEGDESSTSTTSLMEGRDYVRGIALDEMIDHLPTDRPVVLKVDVEGHECLALGGAMKYLNQVPQIVYVAIEWSLERLTTSCDNRQAIFDLFSSKHGLRPYMRVGGNEWKLLDPTDWKTWKQPPPGHRPIVGLYDIAWSKVPPYNYVATT